jgi:hypothetical protein
MSKLEREVKCGRCEEFFIQKWVVAQKKWSQINEISYWTDGKGWNGYKFFCRSCLKKWYDEDRKEFLDRVDLRKRKIFVNYKGSGVFDKPDHLQQ